MGGGGAVPVGGVALSTRASALQPPGSGEAPAARASPCGVVDNLQEQTGDLGRGGGGAGAPRPIPRPRATQAH